VPREFSPLFGDELVSNAGRGVDPLDRNLVEVLCYGRGDAFLHWNCLEFNTQFGPIVNRLFRLRLEPFDYPYIAAFITLSILRLFWTGYGSKENDQLIFWINPVYHSIPNLTLHILNLLCIGALFLLMFRFIPNILAFSALLTVYMLSDMSQRYFKRIDSRQLFSQFSSELTTSQTTGAAIELRQKALLVLRRYNLELPMISLHAALATFAAAVFFWIWYLARPLADDTDINSTLRQPIIVAAYLLLIGAVILDEVVLWSWRRECWPSWTNCDIK
jgi:hypothetical protein